MFEDEADKIDLVLNLTSNWSKKPPSLSHWGIFTEQRFFVILSGDANQSPDRWRNMTFQICVTLQWYISESLFNSCWDKVLFDNNFLNGIFCCPQTNNECIEKAEGLRPRWTKRSRDSWLFFWNKCHSFCLKAF